MSSIVSLDDSILTTVKKGLGLAADYTPFDAEIAMFINTAFFKLHSLGIGPAGGFMITGADQKWSDFIGNEVNLIAVQTYITVDVRLVFDPPETGPLVASLQAVLAQLSYQLNFEREFVLHPPTNAPPEYVFDGGTA